MLKLRKQWRVWDGKPIKIWKDKWVMGMNNLNSYPNFSEINGGESTVDTLIDENYGWDVQKVWSMFNP